jgi:uncharacterized membrane protein YbhN (UPF0104 family)
MLAYAYGVPGVVSSPHSGTSRQRVHDTICTLVWSACACKGVDESAAGTAVARGRVALALVLSLIANGVFVASFHCAARVLWDAEPGNPVPSLTQHFLIVPIGMVILMVPLFPGGAGIGELGFGGLYSWFQCSAANGVLASLVVRVIGWVIGVLGLIVYSLPRARTTPDAEPLTPLIINPVTAAEGMPTGVESEREGKQWPS